MIENIRLIVHAYQVTAVDKRKLFLPVLSLILSNLISFIIPLISIQVIDSIKNSANTGLRTLLYLFITWALAILSIIVLDYFQSTAFRVYGYHMVQRIFTSLISRSEKLPFSTYYRLNAKEEAEIMKRDLEDLQPLFSGVPFILVRHLMVAIITLIAMLIINMRLMMAISVVLPFYIISVFLFQQKIKKEYWIFRNFDASFLKKLIEFRQSVPVCKILSSTVMLKRHLFSDYADLLKTKLKLFVTLNRRRIFSQLLTSLIPVYLIFISYFFITEDFATPGQVFGFWTLFSISISSFGGLSGQYAGLLKALTVYQKIEEDLQSFRRNNRFHLGIDAIRVIRGESLCFSYRNDTNHIRFPSFCIEQGDRIQIIGQSGSGKTTLLRLIFGLIHAQSGLLTVNGLYRSQIRDTEFFKRIGYVEQNGIICSGSIAENVLMGRHFDKSLWQQAVEITGLGEYILEKNIDYTADIGESGIKLSGGERQRILLARALYHQPQWLFLDEPFTGIDSHLRQYVEQMIVRMNNGITFILISHEHISGIEFSGQIIL